MSFSRTKIYNLALSALLLGKEISNYETDTSNEVRVFNTHWDIALDTTLQDLDLDATSQPLELELLANLTSDTDQIWDYVYKYPSKCIFLRRIQSSVAIDNRSTHISKRVGIYNGEKAIFTNEVSAIGECLTDDTPITNLNPMAIMAIAYKLAMLSAPLITGKGAAALRKELKEDYVMFKYEAQQLDSLENFVYEADDQRSEFVAARLE